MRTAGVDAVFVAADMTDVEGPVTIVETAVARCGRLDGAFNHVGGVVAPGRPAEISADAWTAELQLNLTSVFYGLGRSSRPCWPRAAARWSTTPRLPGRPGSAL